MKSIDLFEAKVRLSEFCDQVSSSGEAVIITRRGKPLVRIDSIKDEAMNIRARRAELDRRYARDEGGEAEFEIPGRS